MTGRRDEFVVDTAWLQEHLDAPGLRVVDCDTRDAYRRLHIPGAVFAEDAPYKDPDDRRFVMKPGQFAEAMSKLGIGEETEVVAYDTNGVSASRLWWCLRYFGHARVRVLDGGWQAWLAEGRPVSAREHRAAPARFTPRVDESVFASGDYLLAGLARPDVVVLDVRSDAEWTGERAPGGQRPGHIPGSVHLEWLESLTQGDVRRLKAERDLREMLESCGVTPDKEVVTI